MKLDYAPFWTTICFDWGTIPLLSYFCQGKTLLCIEFLIERSANWGLWFSIVTNLELFDN